MKVRLEEKHFGGFPGRVQSQRTTGDEMSLFYEIKQTEKIKITPECGGVEAWNGFRQCPRLRRIFWPYKQCPSQVRVRFCGGSADLLRAVTDKVVTASICIWS